RNRHRRPSFDSLYDVSDDEAEEVPLKISASLKKIVNRDPPSSSARSSRSRYPSITIPSPSNWPTIQKLKSTCAPISPALPTPLKSPAAGLMQMIAARAVQVPNGSATPSLDGSFTSEELDKLSCPSTPDLHKHNTSEADWLPPTQLHPQALQTLHSLSGPGDHLEPVEDSEWEEMPSAEMEQVDHVRNVSGLFPTPVNNTGEDPLSALSIPSPGGFFSSLDSNTRHTWSTAPTEDAVPSTTVAEEFYGVPWRTSADDIVSRVLGVPSSNGSGPLTAKAIAMSSEQADEPLEVMEIQRNDSVRTEYDPNYPEGLQIKAGANIDRTGTWLNAQVSYLAALIQPDPAPSPIEGRSDRSRNRSNSAEHSVCSPSKKSVRFIDEALPISASSTEEKETKETVFVEAFAHLWDSTQKRDVYIQRQIRADALHTMRRHMAHVHRKQLLGLYEISTVARPVPPRPVSSFYSDDSTVLKERIARAQKEKQALDQVRPAVWVLEAIKFLNGGKLITPVASRALSRATSPRILDVGGKTVCDWAWQVCFDHPHATVYTATTEAQMDVEGPENHKHTVVPNYWTFPFPSNHFDVISARSLYALLKTDKPTGKKTDELDLCLKECMRCLRPGGYLEFTALDSDIMHGGPLALAMSVEFGYNLKTRGYDPLPTRTFVPRLNLAGFKDIKRSWTFLPMGIPAANWTEKVNAGPSLDRTITTDGVVVEADLMGCTADVAAITGLVGSWMWERWLIKMQTEMGKAEEKQLEGVAAVMEEGPKHGAGWRLLSGWARK
ncbi:hypothetical protein EJ05DRAFT_423014, partial [Pseudovirgaria hyperparasitica]